MKRLLALTVILLAAQTIVTRTLLSATAPTASVTPVLRASAQLQLTSSLSEPGKSTSTWSLGTQVGTVSYRGLYTAPASITSVQTVLVTNSAQPGSIAITLRPTVTLSLSPAQATIFASQTQKCTATLTGAADSSLSWSISPVVGSISTAGLYTAPSSGAAPQTVTVTAISVADPDRSATTRITVNPAVTISLSPASAQLFASQRQSFDATVTGAANAATAWSLAPAIGTVVNGLYTAPATIPAQQTVTLTATSIADPTKSANATITLVPVVSVVSIAVAPSSISLLSGQTSQFASSIAGTSNTTTTWSLAPAIGTVVNGLYTAPATIPAQQTVTLTATSVADPTKSANATITLTSSQITFPIEVVGPDGTVRTVSFNIPSESNLGNTTLSMTIHGLRYQTQASLQFNNYGWRPISEGSVTLLGQASAYGGIGGGFHTIQMTMPVPAGAITTGTNTLTFRFNGTDGRVSGFRVLAFNIQDSAGNSLIPSGNFVEEDPNIWQPPSTNASDITAGQQLWHQASLTVPTSSGTAPIQAHCADCHAQDGRDLKYFNYSNNSIQSRSLFHGLTAQQGNQIASYIRSLNVVNPGRVWNPPYQPGTGLDSQPTSNWSGGAGIDAVLDSDADMLPYLTPGGSTTGWAANQYLNPRELPIAIQLPDWNSWLPTIHPLDGLPNFATSKFNTYYPIVRSVLAPDDGAKYSNARFTFDNWSTARGVFLDPIDGNVAANWDANNLREAVYSAGQWHIVKLWEINQEFGLEAMPQAIFGSTANTRAWYGGVPFFTSPTLNHIPAGTGLGNGSDVTQIYLSLVWYHMQLILNDGQGQESDHTPIDFPYAVGRIKDLSLAANSTPEIALTLEWLVKTLQEETLSGNGPEKGILGWHPTWDTPSVLVHEGFDSIWTGTAPGLRTSLTESWTRTWFAQVQNYTPQQFYLGSWANATVDPATLSFDTNFGGQVWFALPRLRYYGVDPNLTYQISAWAATIWPVGSWALNNSATCSTSLICTSGY